MKKINLFTILLIALLLASCGCQEPDCPSLSDSDKEWIPYFVGQKITFKNFQNDSLLTISIIDSNHGTTYNKAYDMDCDYSCMSYQAYYVEFNRNIENKKRKSFIVNKWSRLLIEYQNTSNQYFIFSSESVRKNSEFYFNDAILLDSIQINNQYLKDVYKYITIPTQYDVAETYVKKGKGLVKLVYRDGASYELVD